MKVASITLLIALVLFPFSAGAEDGFFDPNNLISDQRFVDMGTLGGGAEGIQKFLETQGSVLANISPDFLVKLREPGDTDLKSRLPDPRPNLGRLRTAAELIYDSATAAGLNPQVILVTLQKEQTLVNGKSFSGGDLQRALDRAVGFGCPDEGGCSDLFLGFYHQLFGNFDSAGNRYIGMPASLVRSFNYEVSGTRVGRGPMVDEVNNVYGNGNRVRTSRKSDTITLENTQGPPNNAALTQAVTLSNFATTALYRYTPHVYNGNYNFWRFFNKWFKYANNTLIQSATDPKIYIVDNGLRRPISALVISQRGLNSAMIVSVSPVEFGEFTLGDVMPPKDGTILKNSLGQIYLIEEGTRKLLSSFVAAQRKLDVTTALNLPDDEIISYKDGGRALPAEGTLVKSKDSPAIYMIATNQKRLLTAFIFKQRKLKFSDVLQAEPGELDTYESGTLMPPLDGTLIKASGEASVYHVGNGKLEYVSGFVFAKRGFKLKNVATVAKVELSFWEIGKPMPPPTGLLVLGKTGKTVYYIESGTKRPISHGAFLANHFRFKDVSIASDADLELIELGEEMKLPERALVKTTASAAVYYVVDGVLRPLTLTAFKNRALRFQDVATLSAEEFAKYPVGALVEN